MAHDYAQITPGAVASILGTIEEISHLKDVDTILDKILSESRKIAHSDAGSIYLVEDGKLLFSFVQNDSLFPRNQANAALYQNYAISIDEASIVGHVAMTKTSLAIDDAYALEPTLPYSFNRSFDERSGYRTVSMLTLPLVSQEERLVGVMQLINAQDEQTRIVPFARAVQTYLSIFCSSATTAIERGMMNRELMLRMMQMAELRDPSETGAHVQRVGAYCAEIYRAWAGRRNLEPREIKRTRDNIRLAAMLHDVGKVGISDAILKKPGRLTEEEFETVKWHTIYGARLFRNRTSGLDRMSLEIALNHHEKWAGGGYPGRISDIWEEMPTLGPPKVGEEIPIAARITAVADVFDALISRRCYKEGYPEEKVLAIMEESSGTHLDPELVEIFMEIYDVVKAIRGKYQERPERR